MRRKTVSAALLLAVLLRGKRRRRCWQPATLREQPVVSAESAAG